MGFVVLTEIKYAITWFNPKSHMSLPHPNYDDSERIILGMKCKHEEAGTSKKKANNKDQRYNDKYKGHDHFRYVGTNIWFLERKFVHNHANTHQEKPREEGTRLRVGYVATKHAYNGKKMFPSTTHTPPQWQDLDLKGPLCWLRNSLQNTLRKKQRL